MKTLWWLCCFLLMGCAHAPRERATAALSLPDDDPVQVRWHDPAGFTEYRRSAFAAQEPAHWVTELANEARRIAQPRLAAGERLQITFIDIDRAGEHEPWRGLEYQHTRIVRDLYPPRIRLHFTVTGADGAIKREGERALTDAAFLQRASVSSSDPLRYEKQLLRDWIRREFPEQAR